LTITPSKALVHSHPYVHEDLGPSLAPVNEIGPSVAADHSNAVARINPAFVCIRVKLDAGQKNAGSAGLSGNRSHAYRFAEPRTDAADVMSTIELVDPELRDALALWPVEPLTADSLTTPRQLAQGHRRRSQTGSA
jgi:hypothetical protein